MENRILDVAPDRRYKISAKKARLGKGGSSGNSYSKEKLPDIELGGRELGLRPIECPEDDNDYGSLWLYVMSPLSEEVNPSWDRAI